MRVWTEGSWCFPLMLLPLGCSFCVDAAPSFQTAPLAGDAAGLKKFAGQWFDENGNLIAVISISPEPRLSARTPYELEPKDARLQNGKIVFRLTSDDPEEISLRLTGEDELAVDMGQEEQGGSSLSCIHPFPAIVLVRNPTPAWHMERSVRKTKEVTAEFARDAYHGTMDLLARTL